MLSGDQSGVWSEFDSTLVNPHGFSAEFRIKREEPVAGFKTNLQGVDGIACESNADNRSGLYHTGSVGRNVFSEGWINNGRIWLCPLSFYGIKYTESDNTDYRYD
jgi:hypothetical protein